MLTLGAATLVLAALVGCTLFAPDSHQQGELIRLSRGYDLTLQGGWTATWDTEAERAQRGDDSALVVHGLDRERVDIFPATIEGAREHLLLQKKLIESGELDGSISRVMLWGEPADVMVGVVDESTGEHMVVAYLWGSGQPMGLQAFGLAQVERMIEDGASVEEILAAVTNAIGLAPSSTDG